MNKDSATQAWKLIGTEKELENLKTIIDTAIEVTDVEAKSNILKSFDYERFIKDMGDKNINKWLNTFKSIINERIRELDKEIASLNGDEDPEPEPEN